MAWKIPLFKIYHDVQDVEMVSNVISSGMFWATGPNVQKFEESLQRYFGVKYVLTMNSGTSALFLALEAHGVGPKDEVIVPSFTFIATANVPLMVGAVPVFADIETDTLGLDPEDVKNKITKKTKAIIPVHYAGCPCDVKALREIADDHKLVLIEDAAEAFGATIDDTKVGTIGDSSIMSFCANKIISTGEGGAILTDDKDLFEKLKLLRSHGRAETEDYFESTKMFDYVQLGYNFRMSNITAALGKSQLSKVDKIISLRKALARKMIAQIRSKRIEPFSPPEPYNCVYQMFPVLLESTKDRDVLQEVLNSKGIQSKVYFSPVHHTYYYKTVLKTKVRLPVTESVSSKIVCLPFWPTMTDGERETVVNAVKEFEADS